jgi:hypothetical protein
MLEGFAAYVLNPKRAVTFVLTVLACGLGFMSQTDFIAQQLPGYGKIVCFAGMFACFGAIQLARKLPD